MVTMLQGEITQNSDVELKPFTVSDIPRLMQWIPSSKFLLQWAGPGYSFPFTEAQIIAHLTGHSAAAGSTVILKVVLRGTDIPIGHGEILGIDVQQRSAVLGRILIGPGEYRGRGYGLALVRALTRFAFENFPIHRLALNVFSTNETAIKCYTNAGFVKEGELRDARFFENQFISITIMSMLYPQFNQIYYPSEYPVKPEFRCVQDHDER